MFSWAITEACCRFTTFIDNRTGQDSYLQCIYINYLNALIKNKKMFWQSTSFERLDMMEIIRLDLHEWTNKAVLINLQLRNSFQSWICWKGDSILNEKLHCLKLSKNLGFLLWWRVINIKEKWVSLLCHLRFLYSAWDAQSWKLVSGFHVIEHVFHIMKWNGGEMH